MNIGALIKIIRNNNSLTQDEFGRLCLRSKDWVYLVENGKLEPSIEDLIIIGTKINEPLLTIYAYGLSAYKAIMVVNEIEH